MSDHCPLFLNTRILNEERRKWHFKFEAAWLVEDSCELEVRRLWNNATGLIPELLRTASIGLDSWFRKLRAARKITTTELRKRLETLMEMAPTDETLAEIVDIKLALNLENGKTELYWEQRARVNWLKHGDKNSAFFHS
ncbi:hypothetical protein F3Y22_tig00110556pilonHSYRG00784 [Hibiscus syriacus]|uniref:Reverse transcriptase n=1 Tax=Hibiscus syriacus TaxID=106335 RepID=A0A6A3A9Z7_HIBSY|nr:hypothetical protein F3Y22_tig00110556pilonHSYRG00784 [Hibiscus syriacus]